MSCGIKIAYFPLQYSFPGITFLQPTIKIFRDWTHHFGIASCKLICSILNPTFSNTGIDEGVALTCKCHSREEENLYSLCAVRPWLPRSPACLSEFSTTSFSEKGVRTELGPNHMEWELYIHNTARCKEGGTHLAFKVYTKGYLKLHMSNSSISPYFCLQIGRIKFLYI